jgi:hypothetical protein
MATDPVRVYLAINADTAAVPTEDQWRALFVQAKIKPLAHAVVLAARAAQNDITCFKRSLNVTYLRRWTLVGFEVNKDDVDALTVVLNAQAAARGVTGTLKQKFLGTLQAELQESAIDLGYSAAQAAKITMTWVGFGTRETAIAEAQAYLAANGPTIWWA